MFLINILLYYLDNLDKYYVVFRILLFACFINDTLKISDNDIDEMLKVIYIFYNFKKFLKGFDWKII